MLGTAIRGYFAALAAGNTIFWASGLIKALVFGGPLGNDVGVAGFIIVVVLILIASMLLTILPFIVFCAISWIFDIRNLAFFALSGVAIGLLITGLVIGAGWTDPRIWARNASLWQQLSLSGAVGGFAYWRTAVHTLVRSAAPE